MQNMPSDTSVNHRYYEVHYTHKKPQSKHNCIFYDKRDSSTYSVNDGTAWNALKKGLGIKC